MASMKSWHMAIVLRLKMMEYLDVIRIFLQDDRWLPTTVAHHKNFQLSGTCCANFVQLFILGPLHGNIGETFLGPRQRTVHQTNNPDSLLDAQHLSDYLPKSDKSQHFLRNGQGLLGHTVYTVHIIQIELINFYNITKINSTLFVIYLFIFRFFCSSYKQMNKY